MSIAGTGLFQGDIQLTMEQEQLLSGNGGRKFSAMKTSLWPQVIPYDLSAELGMSTFL